MRLSLNPSVLREWYTMGLHNQGLALKKQIELRLPYLTPAQHNEFTELDLSSSTLPDLKRLLAQLKTMKGW